MLHLIPAPLHRAGLRLAHALRRRWWQLAQPRLEGVALVTGDGAGRVLLVRHCYGATSWTFPGGGLRRGEDKALAIRREIAEELGCGIAALALAGEHRTRLHGAHLTRHVFVGELHGDVRPDGREVSEARLFALSELPAGCSPMVHELLRIAAGIERQG